MNIDTRRRKNICRRYPKRASIGRNNVNCIHRMPDEPVLTHCLPPWIPMRYLSPGHKKHACLLNIWRSPYIRSLTNKTFLSFSLFAATIHSRGGNSKERMRGPLNPERIYEIPCVFVHSCRSMLYEKKKRR